MTDIDIAEPGVSSQFRRGLPSATSTLRQPLVIGAALLAIYCLVATMVDPRGHLLTDVGGKAIGLEAMVERGDWEPDIGYWFEESDPQGVLYPFDKTRLTADGQWVNTTSLTMLYAARAMWMVGGLRAALLLPMLGSVLAALAAGAIERRVDDESDGAASTWVVGLATPAFVYALDFWEHAIALGALAWAVVLVMDATKSNASVIPAIIAGLCFGVAATMRQEAMAYAFVAGVVLFSVLVAQASFGVAVRRSLAMATAGSSVLAAYAFAEIALTGDSFRSARSVDAASTHLTWLRHLRAAATTTVGPLDGDTAMSLLVGALLVGSAAWLTVCVVRGKDATFAFQCVGVLWISYFVALILRGPAFVPGTGPATPLAMVGLIIGIDQRRWLPLSLAVVPLPLIWLTAYPSGSVLQWGGRYQLLSGLVLTVLAVTLVRKIHRRVFVVGLSAAIFMTAFGVSWVAVRSHRVANTWDTIASVTTDDEVVIWRDTVKAREAGAFAYGKPWLGASHGPEQSLAAALLLQADVSHFVWIDEKVGEYEVFDGFIPIEEIAVLEFFGLRMTTYDRDPTQLDE